MVPMEPNRVVYVYRRANIQRQRGEERKETERCRAVYANISSIQTYLVPRTLLALVASASLPSFWGRIQEKSTRKFVPGGVLSTAIVLPAVRYLVHTYTDAIHVVSSPRSLDPERRKKTKEIK